MSNTYFRFKQFTITQSNATMKVNTDGVLLGAWAEVSGASRILDVGTGTGVIALMLAQRNADATLDAVEIDEAAAGQAHENVAHSAWHNRIRVIHDDFRSFSLLCQNRYDAVISNPPYFVNALLSPEAARTLARHAAQLPHESLIEGALKTLNADGKLHVVLPYVEGTVFIAQAAAAGLYCIRKTNVRPASDKPVKRLLLTFARYPDTLHENTLCIHLPGNTEYTPEYRALTRDFYLKF